MENGKKRVVVTGVGLVTPLGHNVEDSWGNILAGKSGFTRDSQQINMEGLGAGGVCEIKDFDAAHYLGRKEARRRDRFQQIAAVAVEQAMTHSGLKITDDNRQRIGVLMGTGVGGINTSINTEWTRYEKGARRVSPFCVPMIMPNGAAGMAAIDYGIQGPSSTVTTACAAGCDGVGMAYNYISHGLIDAAITGGSEAPLTAMTVAGFERAGAISFRTDGTPSPFDKSRDGLIPGEGAGMLVVESLEHALARGATILGEIMGYGQTTDAFHITAPAPGGAGAQRAIKHALADAGLQPSDIDYVSAHGTGTMLNDQSETAALKGALGEHAYNVAISSTKSATGHIMGGTGAIESVFSILAIRDQMMPPTINHVEPSEDCDLDYIPNEARAGKVDYVLNNAFGFGGHNAVLVIGKYHG